MKKEKDLEFTFLIPVRIDTPARLANLEAVINFYLREMEEASFIILEADTSSRLDGVFESKRVTHKFVNDENIIFHRTKYINMLFRMSETSIAAVWDADVIVPPVQIRNVLSTMANDSYTMAYPYGGIFWSVGIHFSSIFRRSLDLRILTYVPQPRVLMCGYHSVGGAFMVNIDKYRLCGWENEHFAGWGPEDAERYVRMEILGNKPYREDGMMYHLYHPRGINSGMSDTKLAISTKREFCKVCAMKKLELLNYIKKWEWTT